MRSIDYLLNEIKFERIPGCPYKFYYSPEQLLWATHDTPEGKMTTRKWYVSKWATDGEVVQTVLKLCLTSAEHEAREAFKYKGKAIFGPHLVLDDLLDIADHTAHRPEREADPVGAENS